MKSFRAGCGFINSYPRLPFTYLKVKTAKSPIALPRLHPEKQLITYSQPHPALNQSPSKCLPSGHGERTTLTIPQAISPFEKRLLGFPLQLSVLPVSLLKLLEARVGALAKLLSVALLWRHPRLCVLSSYLSNGLSAPSKPNPMSAVSLYSILEVTHVFILFLMLENTKLQLCNSIKIQGHQILRTVACTCKHTNLEIHQKQGLVRVNSNYRMRRQP